MPKRTSYFDSIVMTATVAATAETLVGFVNVPENEEWIIKKIWCSHPKGGDYRLHINSRSTLYFGKSKIKEGYPYFGQFIQQSVFDNDDTTPNVLFANPESMYDINVSVRGPDRIEIHTTNSAANSGTCKAMLQFERIDNNLRLGKRI